jgi:predicted transcriptional regulator
MDSNKNSSTQSVTIRLNPELARQLDEMAKRERRSRSQLISFAIEEFLKRDAEPEPGSGEAATGSIGRKEE